MGILVSGAVMVDVKGYPLAQYIPAGRNAGRVIQVYGGVSRNIVEDIANIGLAPTYLSVVDESAVGRDIVDKLAERGVDTRYVRAVPDGLGMWLAIFGNDGDVIGSISKRPDLQPLLEVLDEKGDEIVSRADSVCMEMDMDEAVALRLLELSEKYHKKVFAVVSNMSIVLERRELLQKTYCFVCNRQEAGMLFSEHYEGYPAEQLERVIADRARQARIPRMIVTLGDAGSVYSDCTVEGGDKAAAVGYCPGGKVDVIDTTGAGDAFFAGVSAGMTYGKTIQESCTIGTRLAASVISTRDSVCPVFMPEEFGLRPQDQVF